MEPNPVLVWDLYYASCVQALIQQRPDLPPGRVSELLPQAMRMADEMLQFRAERPPRPTLVGEAEDY